MTVYRKTENSWFECRNKEIPENGIVIGCGTICCIAGWAEVLENKYTNLAIDALERFLNLSKKDTSLSQQNSLRQS